MAMNHQAAPLLRIEHLSKAFDGIQALNDVSFSVGAGELVALIGPNGAGKTTCFNVINGQLEPDAGSVWLAGERIDGLPPQRIATAGVGRTFQTAATFASMTARENVQLALLAGGGEYVALARRLVTAHRSEADALLARVGAGSFAEQICASLSYADVKRVELAIATLFTEHDVDVVFRFAARVIVLDRGRIIADGPPASVRADPRVQAVYLGTEA